MPAGGRIGIHDVPLQSRISAEVMRAQAGWVRRFRPDGVLAFPLALGLGLEAEGFSIPGDFGLATPYTFPSPKADRLISGCDCRFEQFEHRAVERLYKLLQLGERGVARDVVEEVVEPVWVEGETLPMRG